MSLNIQHILTKSLGLYYSNMVIEKIADISIDKVHCRYFDEGSSKVYSTFKRGKYISKK